MRQRTSKLQCSSHSFMAANTFCLFFLSLLCLAINNSNCIEVCLCAVAHETFEVWIWYAIVVHHFVQTTPKYKLSLSAFRLHIADSDGHHLAVGGVINMVGNGGPWLHSLHVIEHDEAILEVTSRLHPSHEVDATPGAMHEHFEEIYLFLALAREYTVMYELDLCMPLHL